MAPCSGGVISSSLGLAGLVATHPRWIIYAQSPVGVPLLSERRDLDYLTFSEFWVTWTAVPGNTCPAGRPPAGTSVFRGRSILHEGGASVAKNEKTGKKAATAASKVLRDPKSSKPAKTAAASALSQAPDKKKSK